MKLGLIFLAVTAIACSPAPCPPTEPRAGSCAQVVDGGAPPPATCSGACMNMRVHSCELAKPTPKGASCEQVCETVQRENAGAGFNVSCLSKAKSCVEADACR